MPKGITTNMQLQQLVKCMRIPYFRVFLCVLPYQQGGCIERERYHKFE